eukprot:scaffold29122_cov100-Skeletonema_dohrnii-CCMP3373.AAC.1
MPYTGLGFAAGIITGIGLTGCVWLLIALLRSRAADKDQSLQVVDVEQGSEAIVNDSNGEQDSNNNNTTITAQMNNSAMLIIGRGEHGITMQCKE